MASHGMSVECSLVEGQGVGGKRQETSSDYSFLRSEVSRYARLVIHKYGFSFSGWNRSCYLLRYEMKRD